ncbi:hypothetical protein [Paenibacillus sp. YPG26]|uniref:hypothetical protein n=1 Tax=Paenibacillus sp. YPG26 TaxID=2878915 RepID=UPI00203F3210|nr:hypothetical protein [Paenibacillus sp. YPG26]USB34537.1 hypothetical protein LDO05_07165 [Paenibacillus sp. YPG26]
MARIGVIAEFDIEARAPAIILVKLSPDELDWSTLLYIKATPPWEQFEPEEFGDMNGVTVLLEDILMVQGNKDFIGIDLPRLYQRHQNQDIGQLIIRLQDVEEVLNAYT